MPPAANAHVCLVSQAEAQLLADILGQRLERIRLDGGSASLEFDSIALLASPAIGTGSSPMHLHTEELMRLSLRRLTAEESACLYRSRYAQLDLRRSVRDIHILHSLVTFTEPAEVGPQRMGPIQLPGSLGYDAKCVNPSTVNREYLEQLVRRGCANFVDIGIFVSFEDGDPVVIRTNGSAWKLFVTTEPIGSAHQETAVAVPLVDRGARPFSQPPSS